VTMIRPSSLSVPWVRDAHLPASTSLISAHWQAHQTCGLLSQPNCRNGSVITEEVIAPTGIYNSACNSTENGGN
jgi:hypothetical protein